MIEGEKMDITKSKTLGDLIRMGYRTVSVKDEMRKNLISMLNEGKNPFPGIIGYDETVLPVVENAILSGHNMIFLGERGQAKSKIIRSLVNLLDPYIPAVEGCEINDDPFKPVCGRCRRLKEKLGENLEIRWIPREKRYNEKLATPDVSIADLIGEIDPIKISEGRYLSDEEAIHFGLVPRSNRGIFAINELPDLPERVQVSLFNVMEEGDIQIKGYTVRLVLDVLIVATANPEDYTNRGRIVTPLKDRFDAQVRTHYPITREIEISIMEQEAKIPHFEGIVLLIPYFMKEIIAEITFVARRSPEVNQHSGVSVRMSIANYESIISNSIKRALKLKEKVASPRISDLPMIKSSTSGKIEYEYSVERKDEDSILENIIRTAVKNIFNKYWSPDDFKSLLDFLNGGVWIEVGDDLPAEDYLDLYRSLPELSVFFKKVIKDETPALLASAIEFALEGLYSHKLIRKNIIKGRTSYTGMI